MSGGQQREIIVSKSDTKVLITDYNPSKDYTVSVISVSGTEQSRPLQGRHKGGLIHFNPFLLLFTPIYCIYILLFYLSSFLLLALLFFLLFSLPIDIYIITVIYLFLQLKEVRTQVEIRLSHRGGPIQLHLLRMPMKSLEVGQTHPNTVSRRGRQIRCFTWT